MWIRTRNGTLLNLANVESITAVHFTGPVERWEVQAYTPSRYQDGGSWFAISAHPSKEEAEQAVQSIWSQLLIH